VRRDSPGLRYDVDGGRGALCDSVWFATGVWY